MRETPRPSHPGAPRVEPGSTATRLELAVAALVAVTVLLVAAGSAWRPDIKSDAANLRWAALFALTLAALALAFQCLGSPPTRAERRIGMAASALAILFVA